MVLTVASQPTFVNLFQIIQNNFLHKIQFFLLYHIYSISQFEATLTAKAHHGSNF